MHSSPLLTRHQGKTVEITINDFNINFFLIIRPEKVHLYSYYTDLPNTKINGSMLALLKQMFSSSYVEEINIEGDMDLAQDLQYVIKTREIEWQEPLSHLLGDFASEKTIRYLKELQQSLAIHKKRGLEDIIDYLQEEKRLFPTLEEIEDFYQEIAQLRKTIDRLEARCDRLMEHKK
jgi:ubiquinone biosynthesis accessory factor UbiJ